MTAHLTPARIAEILAGQSSEEEERELAAHLAAGDCQDCEAGLLALSDAEEAQLLALLDRVENAPDLAPPAALGRGPAPRRPRRSWARIWAPVAACAAVALAILVLWPAGPQEDGTADGGSQRTKGRASSWARASMSLGQVLRGEDGRARIERVRDGQVLPAGVQVVFQLRLEEACFPYLIHLSDGSPELLLPGDLAHQTRLSQGQHTPRAGGKPLGVDTAGYAGPQTFVCLCSRTQLTDRTAIHRAAARPDDDLPAADRVRIVIAAGDGGP